MGDTTSVPWARVLRFGVPGDRRSQTLSRCIPRARSRRTHCVLRLGARRGWAARWWTDDGVKVKVCRAEVGDEVAPHIRQAVNRAVG